MRKILSLLVMVTWSFCVVADPVNYSNLNVEHYEKITDKTVFTAEDGQQYKVKNKKKYKGLYIGITKNGRTVWLKHGVFYRLYDNGQISELVTYQYDKKHGLKESYTTKGVVKFRYYHENNKRHGLYLQFSDKGDKVYEVNYENGLEQGKSYDYAGGKIYFIKSWVDGKRHGETLQYNTSNGKLVARKQYSKGKQIGKTEWLH